MEIKQTYIQQPALNFIKFIKSLTHKNKLQQSLLLIEHTICAHTFFVTLLTVQVLG